MATGMVVLTPGSPYPLPAVTGVVADLSGLSYPDEEWTARVALDIAAACAAQPSSPPLLLVFTGTACLHAPHVGFAQRAARRAISGYVLVDPVLPRPGAVPDWPEAPVTVVLSDDADNDTRSAALGARLRGWEIVEGDPPTLITESAERP